MDRVFAVVVLVAQGVHRALAAGHHPVAVSAAAVGLAAEDNRRPRTEDRRKKHSILESFNLSIIIFDSINSN